MNTFCRGTGSICDLNLDEITGLQRIDTPDYPAIAVREALLNALLHRDYSFSGSIIININTKQMEFISLGGLVSGLTVKDICSGISQPRNRYLAELFHRLELIESYGTGIRRIFSLYADHPVQPEIQVTANTFKLTRTYILMNTMKEKGLIQIQGRGPKKRFLLP